MSQLDPNSFQDSLTNGGIFGPSLSPNGPAIPDQYGNPYVAAPRDFIITSNTGIQPTAIAADRLATQAASSNSWLDSIGSWFKDHFPAYPSGPAGNGFDQYMADHPVFSPLTSVGNAVSAVASKAKNAVTSSVWTLVFVVVGVLVGYIILKTAASREATRVLG